MIMESRKAGIKCGNLDITVFGLHEEDCRVLKFAHHIYIYYNILQIISKTKELTILLESKISRLFLSALKSEQGNMKHM